MYPDTIRPLTAWKAKVCRPGYGPGRPRHGHGRPAAVPSRGWGAGALRLAAALALLALAACASPTYYAAADGGEGYTDQQIDANHYRVSFSGNSVTARNVVDNYMLYRCAEVTLASGHDYFILVQHDVERDVRYHSFVDVPPGGYYYGYPYFYGPYDWTYGGYADVYSTPIERYRAFATIAVFSGKKPEDNPNAYDAREVENKLSGLILRPAGG